MRRPPISDIQLLQRYSRRYEVQQSGLPFRVARDTILQWTPEEQIEARGDDQDESSDSLDRSDSSQDGCEGDEAASDTEVEAPDHPDVIRMTVNISPDETRPTEQLNELEPRRSGRKRGAPLRTSLAVDTVGTDHSESDDEGAVLYQADLSLGHCGWDQ